jgi:hypothetical protein
VLPYPTDGAFVLFNGCRAGERSLYGHDGSYFTQALAEVLDRRPSGSDPGRCVPGGGLAVGSQGHPDGPAGLVALLPSGPALDPAALRSAG